MYRKSQPPFSTPKSTNFQKTSSKKLCLMDSLKGMCEWVSDSRDSAWLANPCELRIDLTDVLCTHHVGSAHGLAIRTISRRLVNHRRTRANSLGLRIHTNS